MGNRYALHRLAGLHQRGFGWGANKDPDYALQLLEQSADLGFPEAALDAGRMHAVSRDPDRAALFMTFAALDDLTHADEAFALQAKAAKERG